MLRISSTTRHPSRPDAISSGGAVERCFPQACHLAALFLTSLTSRCLRHRQGDRGMHKSGNAFIGAVVAVVLATLALPVSAPAQPAPTAQSEEARQNELDAAYRASEQAGTAGPADITLIDQAVFKLPDGYFFIPKAEGARMLRALGNAVSDSDPTFVGLVVGTKASDQWIIVTRFIKEGYIKDDEAKEWKADELLQNLKDGTAEANKDRVARGFPEMEILGWVEEPTYDPATHRLVWSMLAKEKDEPDSAEKTVNYNT